MVTKHVLWLSNSLGGKKEQFISQNGNKVLMYVCGITPYDFAHIGHGRCYASFDLLFRLLKFLGYEVRYCRNYTDIDDKLLNKSEQLYQTKSRYQEIANRYIASFQESMQQLNCIAPTIEPKVTDNIEPIIRFIEALIKKGHAYESAGDVYFDITKFPSYGKLSGQKIDELIAGTRLSVREEKRHPLDFALWKKESEDFFWKSRWGIGRPGWHIECSALAKTYLGDFVDIHCGGLDLIFPHHENEVAQSESLLGHTFAKYWLHNGLVTKNTEKMSKSLGNTIQLHDLFNKYHPMQIRYYFLTQHYRAPLPFSDESLIGCAKAYHKLCLVLENAGPLTDSDDFFAHDLLRTIIGHLLDDLNTPAVLGLLFENLGAIRNDRFLKRCVRALLQNIFGLSMEIIEQAKPNSIEIERLIEERNQARAEKNWKRADEIRDALKKHGIEVHDEKK